jgi:hypothetical protein
VIGESLVVAIGVDGGCDLEQIVQRCVGRRLGEQAAGDCSAGGQRGTPLLRRRIGRAERGQCVARLDQLLTRGPALRSPSPRSAASELNIASPLRPGCTGSSFRRIVCW